MRNIKRMLFFLPIILTAQMVISQSIQEDDRIKQRIDDYLTKGVSKGLTGTVLVYKEGKTLLNKGYGFADKENEILNTPTTVFDIGSVSKQFTAAAILKLEEQGKLKVEDVLSKFFDNLPEDKKNITIHQLLIHSAGIIRAIGKSDFDIISTKDYFNELFATQLTHEPGTKHEYSNAGYSILSRIIELVSGQSYESYLNQYLFMPAGMKHTGYLLPKWGDMSIAKGYSYNVMNIGTMLERYKKDNAVSWVVKGNGGIHSTQEDLYKWYQALISNNVLSNELVEKMTKPYILEFEGETSYYSYGWVVFQSPRNTKMIAHDGSNGTFFYDYRWFPKEDVLIIYGTNAFTTKIGGIGWWVDKMLFDEAYTPKPIEPDFVSSLLEYSEKFKGSLAELESKIIEQFGSEIAKPFYLNRLSGLYSRNYMFEKAILFAELNIELFPNDSNLWDSLGQAYYNKGNIKNALVAFREAVALDANNSYAQEMIKKLTN
ncbi:serine hydrolase [uncultured Aquimarina sp.]|uniref:serine hydrolase n=1 Tax=uncultured Aquimarina sp. TaxID=575652 RepID=UPI00262E6127|nr:serine hydrolase [uncultured Aquimarina sp.]